MTKTVICFVIYTVMVILASQPASACQVDDFYIMKHKKGKMLYTTDQQCYLTEERQPAR